MSEIRRRDPRREWIARNRLHPKHAAVLAALDGIEGGAASEWLGPNGVIRKNPRAIGFIGPNGVKRIDRSGAQQGGQAAGAARQEAQDRRRNVTIEDPAFLVTVVPDMPGGRLSSHDRDLLAWPGNWRMPPPIAPAPCWRWSSASTTARVAAS